MTAYIAHDTIPADPVRAVTQTVSSPNVDNPVDNLADYATNTTAKWGPLAATTEYVYTCTFAGQETVNYIAFAVHNMPTGTPVRVQTGAGALHETVTTEGTGPQLLLLDTAHVGTDIRLVFDVPSIVEISIGVLFYGRVLELPEGIGAPSTPAPLGRDTVVYPSVAQQGNYLGGHVVRVGWAFRIAQDNVDPGWIEQYWQPLVFHVERYPFFYTWNYELSPDDAIYGWVEKKVTPPAYKNPLYMAWALSCRGIYAE